MFVLLYTSHKPLDFTKRKLKITFYHIKLLMIVFWKKQWWGCGSHVYFSLSSSSLSPWWTADGFVVCCKHPIVTDISKGGKKKNLNWLILIVWAMNHSSDLSVHSWTDLKGCHMLDAGLTFVHGWVFVVMSMWIQVSYQYNTLIV